MLAVKANLLELIWAAADLSNLLSKTYFVFATVVYAQKIIVSIPGFKKDKNTTHTELVFQLMRHHFFPGLISICSK